MVTSELEQLVASIGEAFFARLGSAAVSRGCSTAARTCITCGGGNAAGCVHNTREIVAAGAERLSSCAGERKLDPSIARLIDHTLLMPEATREDVKKLCSEARQY